MIIDFLKIDHIFDGNKSTSCVCCPRREVTVWRKQKLILNLIAGKMYQEFWLIFSWCKQERGEGRRTLCCALGYLLPPMLGIWSNLVHSNNKTLFLLKHFEGWGWSSFGRASLVATEDLTSISGSCANTSFACWGTEPDSPWPFPEEAGWEGSNVTCFGWGQWSMAKNNYRRHCSTCIFVFQLINQKIQASKQLHSSQKFIAVLEYILAIGNHLNENAGKEKAKGFRLSSLAKVSKYFSFH